MFFKLNNFYKVIFIIFTMIGYTMTAEANDDILLLDKSIDAIRSYNYEQFNGDI